VRATGQCAKTERFRRALPARLPQNQASNTGNFPRFRVEGFIFVVNVSEGGAVHRIFYGIGPDGVPEDANKTKSGERIIRRRTYARTGES
jgi:hypothetical protein